MSTAVQSNPIDIEPSALRELLDEGEAVLIDVREPFENSAERIEPSQLHTLRAFDADAVREIAGGVRAVFYCQTGVRSADAARRFAADGEPSFHLAGGIAAWKVAGLATERTGGSRTIDVMRQVQIVAGLLVLTGVLLGFFVSPWMLILSGFVGAGLMFAGLTGFCGMAKVLRVMPWNRAG